MIGGFISKKGVRRTFEMGMCESCKCGGKVHGTVVVPSKVRATFILTHHVPTLFEKEDIDGNRYDRLCGKCIDRIELLEAKRAGDREGDGQ